MMSADSARTALYSAELAAFDGTDLEEVVGVDRVAAVVGEIVEGSWWPGPSVAVRAARSDARSSSARCNADDLRTTIAIATDQATLATAAHELAHALAGPGARHDATFRAAYLDVVAVMTNRSTVDRRGDLHVRQLGDALAAAGLEVGSRRWPAPPDETTNAIAL